MSGDEGWPCPACGAWYREEGYEEYTVGHIQLPRRKVIICPKCGRCMACADKGHTHD